MHSVNVEKSYKLINKLQKMKPAVVIAYLRKIDAYVFEEINLSCLKKQGFEIQRNHRYSGDGGIDGKAIIHGQLYYLQTKRYSSHISTKHVEEFNSLCKSHKVKGLFIHTGKTGRKARIYNKNSSRIEIISGHRLIRLIRNQDIKIKGRLIYKIKSFIFGEKRVSFHA